jgi:hypothetical protein
MAVAVASSTSQYRIKPVPLRYVSEVYYPGVFGDFESTVQNRIRVLRAEPSWLNEEKARFFEYLLKHVDAEKYASLQDEYLQPPIDRGCLKYIDPISWFEHKFAFAHLLELHKKPPMRILDIGTGATHFMVIAHFYGHQAVGTDLPDGAEADDPSHFYNSLAGIYDTTRIPHRIEPNAEVDDLPKNIDLVTAFSVAFNLSRGVLWDIPRWDFFLRSLKRNVLNDNGTLFMTLMNKKLDDKTWEHLKAKSSWSVDREKQIMIKDFSSVL